MVRFIFKLAFGLLGFSVRLLLTLLSLAASDDNSAGPAHQYQRRSSWDRRGYSWTGRPD